MIDIKMTDSGDLVWGANGDLELVTGDSALTQEILFRLKTYQTDWTLQPSVGCSLEDFVGQPNNTYTCAAIEQRILDNLTFDGLTQSPDVSAVPLDENTVFILVEFNSIDNVRSVVQIQSQLNLREGYVYSRVLNRQK